MLRTLDGKRLVSGLRCENKIRSTRISTVSKKALRPLVFLVRIMPSPFPRPFLNMFHNIAASQERVLCRMSG